MVFVSMASDDLLTRTAQDQVYYSGARRRRRIRRGGLPPSQEYLSGFRSIPSVQRTLQAESDMNPSPDNDEFRARSQAVNSTGPIAGFRVTTTYDDDLDPPDYDEPDDDDDGPSFAEIERLQMEQMDDDMACSDSDESASDSTSDFNISTSQFDAFYRRHHPTARERLSAMRDQRRRQRQVTSFVEPPSTEAYSSDGHLHPQNNGLLRPHAQFFIEQRQNMINIKFDPPPYVLLATYFTLADQG